MPDGDFRRPPRLWEEQLQATVDVQSVGISSLAASTVPTVTMPDPGGVAADPAPPHYADIATAPAAPTVEAIIAGMAVTWSGLDSAGAAYPEGMFAQVHVSATSGFTPSSGTLKGTLSRAGTLNVTPLASGTTYYARLVVVDEQAQQSPASAQASVAGGYVDAGNVSFDATALGGIQQNVGPTAPSTSQNVGSTWINTTNGSYNVLELVAGVKTWVQRQWSSGGIAPSSIDTLQLAAYAVTAAKIAADAVTAKLVSGEVIRTTTADAGARVRLSSADGIEVYDSTGRVFQAKPDGTVTVKGAITSGSTITGAAVSGGTISGATIVTNSGNGGRIRMVDASSTPLGTYDALEFYNGGTVRAYVLGASGGLNCFADNVYFANKANTAYAAVTTGPLTVAGSLDASSPITLGYSGTNRAFRIDASGNVYSYGIEAATAGGTANVNCNAAGDRQLRIQTSTVRIKTDVRALGDGLVGVPADKLGAPSDIDAAAVLTLTPVDFESLVDDGQRYVGFIAEDVAAKLPQAAEYDANGDPRNVDTRAVLACLLQVVKDQQAQIADLTARVEALEG